jgi:dihydrofolate reductase
VAVRRLIASEFVTLDGVMEAPGHDQHQDGKNAWALRYAGEDQQRYKAEELSQAGAILVGRVTYEIFAAFWPTAPKDEGFADRMNAIPKYVVSTTLRTASWQNSTIIGRDPAEEIAELKRRPGGDILLFGSADLLNSLIHHDLIDEYRLMVFPVVLGSGKRLFHDAADVTHLRLADTRTFESGVTVLTYRPADQVPRSRYVETYAWNQEQMRSWQAAQNADRVLATVLFTDIVGSTERAAALGDQEWPAPRPTRPGRARGGRTLPRPLREVHRGRHPRHLRRAHARASMRLRPQRRPRRRRACDPVGDPHR